jgi:hypothetical protein
MLSVPGWISLLISSDTRAVKDESLLDFLIFAAGKSQSVSEVVRFDRASILRPDASECEECRVSIISFGRIIGCISGRTLIGACAQAHHRDPAREHLGWLAQQTLRNLSLIQVGSQDEDRLRRPRDVLPAIRHRPVDVGPATERGAEQDFDRVVIVR